MFFWVYANELTQINRPPKWPWRALASSRWEPSWALRPSPQRVSPRLVRGQVHILIVAFSAPVLPSLILLSLLLARAWVSRRVCQCRCVWHPIHLWMHILNMQPLDNVVGRSSREWVWQLILFGMACFCFPRRLLTHQLLYWTLSPTSWLYIPVSMCLSPPTGVSACQKTALRQSSNAMSSLHMGKTSYTRNFGYPCADGRGLIDEVAVKAKQNKVDGWIYRLSLISVSSFVCHFMCPVCTVFVPLQVLCLQLYVPSVCFTPAILPSYLLFVFVSCPCISVDAYWGNLWMCRCVYAHHANIYLYLVFLGTQIMKNISVCFTGPVPTDYLTVPTVQASNGNVWFYMYVYVCTNISTHLYEFVCDYLHVCTYACIYMCICIYEHTHTCVHVCVHTTNMKYMRACVCIYVYKCTCILIYSYVYTQHVWMM